VRADFIRFVDKADCKGRRGVQHVKPDEIPASGIGWIEERGKRPRLLVRAHDGAEPLAGPDDLHDEIVCLGFLLRICKRPVFMGLFYVHISFSDFWRTQDRG